MKSILGIVLIVAAVFLGYMGYEKLQGSKAGLKIGDAEITATDKSKQTAGFAMLGAGGILLIAGAIIFSRKDR